MKIKILYSTYSFSESIKGKIYDAKLVNGRDSSGSFYYYTVRFPHIPDPSYGDGIGWTFPPEFVEVVSDDKAVDKTKPRRIKQKPKKREQTLVMLVYEDGSSYTLKRVNQVVVDPIGKNVSVSAEKLIAQGITRLETVLINFSELAVLQIKKPDTIYEYMFDVDEIFAKSQYFSKDSWLTKKECY